MFQPEMFVYTTQSAAASTGCATGSTTANRQYNRKRSSMIFLIRSVYTINYAILLICAGRRSRERRSFSSGSAESRDLLQWEVGLQQHRRRRPFVLKAEVTEQCTQLVSADPGYIVYVFTPKTRGGGWEEARVSAKPGSGQFSEACTEINHARHDSAPRVDINEVDERATCQLIIIRLFTYCSCARSRDPVQAPVNHRHG